MAFRHCVTGKCSYDNLEIKQANNPPITPQLFDLPGDAETVFIISEMLEPSLFADKSLANSTNMTCDNHNPA